MDMCRTTGQSCDQNRPDRQADRQIDKQTDRQTDRPDLGHLSLMGFVTASADDVDDKRTIVVLREGHQAVTLGPIVVLGALLWDAVTDHADMTRAESC